MRCEAGRKMMGGSQRSGSELVMDGNDQPALYKHMELSVSKIIS